MQQVSILFYQALVTLPLEKGKKALKRDVRKSLAPLFIHCYDENPDVAEVRTRGLRVSPMAGGAVACYSGAWQAAASSRPWHRNTAPVPWVVGPSLHLCCSPGLLGNAALCGEILEEEETHTAAEERGVVEVCRGPGKDGLQAPGSAWSSPLSAVLTVCAWQLWPWPALHTGAARALLWGWAQAVPGKGPEPALTLPGPRSLQLAKDRSRAAEHLRQVLPYLRSPQEPLREAAIRFIGEPGLPPCPAAARPQPRLLPRQRHPCPAPRSPGCPRGCCRPLAAVPVGLSMQQEPRLIPAGPGGRVATGLAAPRAGSCATGSVTGSVFPGLAGRYLRGKKKQLKVLNQGE